LQVTVRLPSSLRLTDRLGLRHRLRLHLPVGLPARLQEAEKVLEAARAEVAEAEASLQALREAAAEEQQLLQDEKRDLTAYAATLSQQVRRAGQVARAAGDLAGRVVHG
jgi:chromosome segregation ATPase